MENAILEDLRMLRKEAAARDEAAVAREEALRKKAAARDEAAVAREEALRKEAAAREEAAVAREEALRKEAAARYEVLTARLNDLSLLIGALVGPKESPSAASFATIGAEALLVLERTRGISSAPPPPEGAPDSERAPIASPGDLARLRACTTESAFVLAARRAALKRGRARGRMRARVRACSSAARAPNGLSRCTRRSPLSTAGSPTCTPRGPPFGWAARWRSAAPWAGSPRARCS